MSFPERLVHLGPSLSLLLAAPFGVAACSDGGVAAAVDGIGAVESPIINGVIDTENPAAIAFASGGVPYASCSGAIVKVDGTHGWATTAAHCVDNIQGKVVMLGHLNQSPREFPIVEIVGHPDYDENIHTWWTDYAVVRFLGADATVPFVPVATPADDVLSLGAVVTLAGYGEIGGGAMSTERRSIDRAIESLDDDTFTYDQATGGICFGDSGGPAFADLPAGRRMVGVTTVVSGADCSGFGGSARASHAYDSFIEPLLTKATFDSCARCFGSAFGTTACRQLIDACFMVQGDCSYYADCLSVCSDEACRNACAAQYPAGKAEYDAMMLCPCDACQPLCDDEPMCGGSGTGCGFVSTSTSCESCISGCCSQARACADDYAECAACFPNCDGSATAAALWDCLDSASCVDTCGLILDPGEGGAGGTGGVGGTGGTGATGTGGDGLGGSTPTGGSGGTEPLGGTGGGGFAAAGGVTDLPLDDRADEDDEEDSSCSVASPPRGSSPAARLVASLVALALLARRRRRRPSHPTSNATRRCVRG